MASSKTGKKSGLAQARTHKQKRVDLAEKRALQNDVGCHGMLFVRASYRPQAL